MVKSVAQYQAVINDYLAHHLHADVDESTLFSAMNYSLMAGGKRLRPALTLAVVEMTGGVITTDCLRAACALELLHTYSLIHDDLPAMDNDKLRRGKATNHVKFGAGMATLAGDGLLTLAFQWVSDSGLPSVVRTELTRQLSLAAGPSGMVAGQARDILGENKTLGLPALRYLHRQKTGALIQYAVKAGGILTRQPQPVMDQLARFGEQYGLAFQIYDDILDVTASAAQLGKATHKDAGEHKNTYPGLLGLSGAKEQLVATLEAAHQTQQLLANMTGHSFDGFTQFLAYFKVRDSVEEKH